MTDLAAAILFASLLSLASCLPTVTKDGIVFLSVGDYGSAGGLQDRVARQMGIYADKHLADFVISVGDNQYPNGVENDDQADVLFNVTFEHIYTAASLQKRWYMIAGNHDHYGNATRQIEFMKRSPRWYMPALYYTETMAIDEKTNVEFVFIDTVLLERMRYLSRGPELQWIRKTLAASTADWLIVVGHYPLYSGGDHGNSADLIKDLRGLFETHKVAAYLSGHDHTMQHLHSGNVDYLISGAAAKQTKKAIKSTRELIYGKPYGGFMMHELTADELKTSIIDDRGAVLYETTTPRINRHKR